MRQKRRRARAVESVQNAADTVGPISRGMSLFAVTRGQFSMLDVVLHVLEQVGKSYVSVWTWRIADYEVAAMENLLARGSILGATLIIDRAGESWKHQLMNHWVERFGPESIKTCRNHAKICRIWNDDFRVLARGSMNLNENPRFEQLDVTEGGDDFDLVERIESEMPCVPREYTNAEALAASQLGKAYEQKTLSFFKGARVWAK